MGRWKESPEDPRTHRTRLRESGGGGRKRDDGNRAQEVGACPRTHVLPVMETIFQRNFGRCDAMHRGERMEMETTCRGCADSLACRRHLTQQGAFPRTGEKNSYTADIRSHTIIEALLLIIITLTRLSSPPNVLHGRE